MSFLGIAEKTFVVFGVSNKKSVGYFVGRTLEAAGAQVVYVAHTEDRKAGLAKVLPNAPIEVLDVEQPEQVQETAQRIIETYGPLQGFVHAIAFANYAGGMKPFHETAREDFLQAVQISCHSFIELAHALRPGLTQDASVVTISISTTSMAAENYGYMAPVKAALDSSVVFLAKSFSEFSKIRFNAVAAGLLKTRSSAGIPGYVDSYLFAEKAILRKEGIRTQEVADTVAFLLSPRSAGINAQRIIVDGGMSNNYFDREIVQGALRNA